ncbi:PQQ-binding-like beta-propeller repeat protein [Streptomyces sp. NRRL F-5630]|uniref:outer membrane protein assembly factor BamB family protein n=1 Tax=Streptomyces sp. NRRL F-5630 TaxID=1463864 RepID=UPI0004C9CADD|nr:PQQ-binding-like beta-propeller repeat protein [Streptomyces sp. NRRL F-5630]
MTQPPQPPPRPPHEPSGGEPPQDTPPGFGPPAASGGFGAPPSREGFGAPPSLEKGTPPADGAGTGKGTPPPPPTAPPAPPTPPGPAYGTPQAAPPPGQPAYGAPHPAPGQGGQAAYGYPHPAPSYATAPYTQQGYGVGQPPAGPGRRGPGPVFWIIGATVLVIALIVGGGVWYANSGTDETPVAKDKDDKKGEDGKDDGTGTDDPAAGPAKEKAPADPAAKQLFTVPMVYTGADSHVYELPGSWLTAKVYARTGISEVNGYDAVTGARVWNLKLPGPVCSASGFQSEEGLTAVLHKSTRPTKDDLGQCDKVTAFDLRTGKALWTKGAGSGEGSAVFREVTVGGGTVAAGGSRGGYGWDLKSGDQVWSPKPGDECYDVGYQGGSGGLAVVRKCTINTDQDQLFVQKLDPKDGSVGSEYKMPPGIDYAHVLSVSPLVVAADVNDAAGDGSGISDFFSIDGSTGKLRARWPADAKTYAASCDAVAVSGCANFAVGGDRLYVPTEDHQGKKESFARTNEIVSFDLATGKLTGQRLDAGEDWQLRPLRMDGPRLLAYRAGPYDQGGQVVSVDTKTMKTQLLLKTPGDERTGETVSHLVNRSSAILFGDGRLYFGQTMPEEKKKPVDSRDGVPCLALAFGTR